MFLGVTKEKELIVLLSILEIGKVGTKRDVLDNIEQEKYLNLDQKDLALKHNRNEIKWRNDLAFKRYTLVKKGYIDDSKLNQWRITEEGVYYLRSLVHQVLISEQKIFEKLQPAVIKKAKCLIQKLDDHPKTKENCFDILENSEEDEKEFPEGKVLYGLHKSRERNSSLAKKAKDKRKREVGKLDCDVCGFNFSDKYGELGEDYIECHHIKPISELDSNSTTRIHDLALVCANCHKILHRKRPWMTPEELKDIISS